MHEASVIEPVSAAIEVEGPEQLEDVMRRLHDSGVPDEAIHVERGSYPVQEVTEDDMGRSIRMGVLIGVPGVYLAVLAMALIAGVSLTEAAWMGIIPAAFCGWFVAGFVYLNASTGAVESKNHTVAEREIDRVVVTGTHAEEVLASLREEVAAA